MTRVAAIDCGTNSVRLLIADGSSPGHLTEVARRLHLTRLGQGVDATGEFHPKALRRTLDAVADFADEIQRAGVRAVRMVATSAARDAGNRDQFFAGVRDRLGVEAEIITGDEEAYLSFRGAITALRGTPAPVLVMDIGGGSTELVVGSMNGDRPLVDHGVSLNIGSVRIRERYLGGDPPTSAQVGAASAHIDALLDSCGVDLGAANTWIGVGGTATSLSALHQQLQEYDRALVHGSRMAGVDVVSRAEWLLSRPVKEVRRLPSMPARRADVICAGALIAARVALRTKTELTVSEADILDGIALGLLDQRAGSTA